MTMTWEGNCENREGYIGGTAAGGGARKREGKSAGTSEEGSAGRVDEGAAAGDLQKPDDAPQHGDHPLSCKAGGKILLRDAADGFRALSEQKFCPAGAGAVPEKV